MFFNGQEILSFTENYGTNEMNYRLVDTCLVGSSRVEEWLCIELYVRVNEFPVIATPKSICHVDQWWQWAGIELTIIMITGPEHQSTTHNWDQWQIMNSGCSNDA